MVRALDEQTERFVDRKWEMLFGTVAAAVGNSQGGRPTGVKDAKGLPICEPFRPWDFFPRLKPDNVTEDGRILPPAPATPEARDEQVTNSLNAWLAMIEQGH